MEVSIDSNRLLSPKVLHPSFDLPRGAIGVVICHRVGSILTEVINENQTMLRRTGDASRARSRSQSSTGPSRGF